MACACSWIVSSLAFMNGVEADDRYSTGRPWVRRRSRTGRRPTVTVIPPAATAIPPRLASRPPRVRAGGHRDPPGQPRAVLPRPLRLRGGLADGPDLARVMPGQEVLDRGLGPGDVGLELPDGPGLALDRVVVRLRARVALVEAG